MSGNAPAAHVQSALGLTGDALVDLFELTVSDFSGNQFLTCFRNGPTVTYDGNVYQEMACQFTGLKVNADGQVARPRLEIMTNPDGIFNRYAFQRLFYGANLTRRTILQTDLLAGVATFDTTFWRITGIPQLIANQGVTFDLRSLSDIPNQYIPARTFTPPEFPFVSLTGS